MKREILAAILISGAVGCAGGSSRELPVGFDQAEPQLRKLYPPMLSAKPGAVEALNAAGSTHAKFVGPRVTVRRNEMADQVEHIDIEEFDKIRNRMTEITLAGSRGGNDCTVSVDATKSKTDVFFPSRDSEFERAVLDDISAAVK